MVGPMKTALAGAARELEIPVVLGQLKHWEQELSKNIVELSDRLTPLLSREPPEATMMGAPELESRPATAPMAESIADAARDLRCLNESVSAILRRLEI